MGVLKFAAGKDVAADITPKGMPTFRASVWQDDRVTSAMPADYIEAYNEEIKADTTKPVWFTENDSCF